MRVSVSQEPETLWSAFGVGKGHLPILCAALAPGGIRVGLEDNVVYGYDAGGKNADSFTPSAFNYSANYSAGAAYRLSSPRTNVPAQYLFK
jgi:hypothetical protein